MGGPRCAKCDGPGVTFDAWRGLILRCDRCHGKGTEPSLPVHAVRPAEP